MEEKSWRGGCLCGGVRYEVSAEGTSLCFCHCTSCRRATGVPAVAWGTFARDQFAVTRGPVAEHRSSPEVLRGFCATCGTSLTYRHERRDREIDVTLATLDDAAAFAPSAHIWVEDKLPWIRLADGLPQFETVRDAAETVRPALGKPEDLPPSPQGFHTVTPRIVARDARGLVAFLKDVFGASGEHQTVRPTAVQIGDSIILVSEGGAREPMPAFLYVYVGDPDEAYRRALHAGARSLEAPAVVPYGDRRCMIEDAWSNTWQIARFLG